MISNYLKTSARSLVKNKVQTSLSVIGLSIGFAVSVLIFLFVNHEFSYDAYHTKADRIYRLANNWKGGDEVTPWARTSTPMAPAIKTDFSEVEEIVRVRKNPRTDLLQYGEDKFYEDGLYFADQEVFRVFSFGLKRGDPETVLSQKYSVVLTEEMANKYFKGEDPIGKTLRYNNELELQVTGILEPVPSNSHFHFDFLADFETAKEILGERRTKNWFWFDIQTYLLLKEGTNPTSVEARFSDLIAKNIPEKYAPAFSLFLQPLTSIHLQSQLKDELEKNSDVKYSYILVSVAVFIILMACINFMNLSTANYTKRSLEVGIRKVFGAQRMQLVGQYLTEAVLLAIISFSLSLALVLLVFPAFVELSGKEMELFQLTNLQPLLLLLLLAVVVGLFAGSYPALYLSSMRPVFAIKGSVKPGKASKIFRNSLVTLQISISVILIVSTLIISAQLQYFQTSNFGFDQDLIITVPIKDRSKNEKHDLLIDRLKRSPLIKNATFTSSIPGNDNAMSFYFKARGSEKDAQKISSFLVDDNFPEAFGLEQIQSLDLPLSENENDSTDYALVNEAFVELFGIEEPVGSYVDGNGPSKIIGVVKDFNVRSLHYKTEPVIIMYGPRWFRYVAVKVSSSNIQESLSLIDQEWQSFYSGFPLEYSFLDESLAKQYLDEEKLSSIFQIFSIIAILIAGLGMAGLASFIVSQRTREIGIRKVLGGSTTSILFMFSKYFLTLIAISVLIAWPVSFYLMNEWLSEFAYRVSLGVDYFLWSLLIIILVIFSSIGYQTIRAALTNPVNTLRYE